MAMTPRQAATLFFGTSLFGLLTFSSGLMIGVGIGSGTSPTMLPNAGGAPLAAAKPPAAPAAAMTASAQGAGAGSVLLPMPQPQKPAVGAPVATSTTSTAAAPPQSAPGATAVASAAATAPAAAAKPIAVKDFRVGLPLDVASASPLRGRLVADALAAPRDLTVAPQAAAGSAAAAGAQTPAGTAAAPAAAASAPAAMPVAAPALSPSPPFVFSVQVGSFLIPQNAERLAAELTRHGYAAQVLVAQSPGEPTWYPVVLTPVNDVATVARQAQEFTASEGRNAEVVSWLAAK